MVNLILPAVAVALVLILELLIEVKNGTFKVQTATDAATRAAMYAAAIAAAEILSVQEPQIVPYLTPAASTFAAAELYRAAQLLIQGTGNKAVAAAVKAAETAAQQSGGDPFGAAVQQKHIP